MKYPDKKLIKELLEIEKGYWSYDEQLLVHEQLKSLYKHWFRNKIKYLGTLEFSDKLFENE